MGNDSSTPFIFYLSLGQRLSEKFYIFDRLLKEHGYILVPVQIDQLQILAATAEQTQIIVLSSVSDSKECKIFNDKIRNLLKFVLKAGRITFMQLSSFSKLDDTKKHILTKNYFFFKYPLDARLLVKKIVRYNDPKSLKNSQWPGGRRAGLTSVTI